MCACAWELMESESGKVASGLRKVNFGLRLAVELLVEDEDEVEEAAEEGVMRW